MFLDSLRRSAAPGLVLLSLFIIFVAVFLEPILNYRVESETVQGKVIHTSFPMLSKTPSDFGIMIELEGGRIITIGVPSAAQVPAVGAQIKLNRYIKRFFGDSFGLK